MHIWYRFVSRWKYQTGRALGSSLYFPTDRPVRVCRRGGAGLQRSWARGRIWTAAVRRLPPRDGPRWKTRCKDTLAPSGWTLLYKYPSSRERSRPRSWSETYLRTANPWLPVLLIPARDSQHKIMKTAWTNFTAIRPRTVNTGVRHTKLAFFIKQNIAYSKDLQCKHC